MTRFIALAVVATLLFTAFCCPPPALALERPQPKVCPLTQQKCETSEADCDPPPPQLATPLEVPAATPPLTTALPPAPSPTTLCEPRFTILNHWTAPNRTIVLRI